jgi:hypothetical protein
MYLQILQKWNSTEALPSNHLHVTICVNHKLINLSNVPSATWIYVFVTHDRGIEPIPPDVILQAFSLSSNLLEFQLPEVVTYNKD